MVVPPTVSPLVAMIAAASAVEVINGRPRAALTVRMVLKGCVRFRTEGFRTEGTFAILPSNEFPQWKIDESHEIVDES